MILKRFPLKEMINWFLNNQRKLPWRENRTAYRVWVSEVMLQQTTVATVIPYFHRWMEIFPDIKSLSLASEELVLKVWEGLGYYSRAKNLYYGSQLIERNFGGYFPEEKEKITSIKGIGPYTLNAILAFAFNKRVCPVDGNVLRVLSRFFAIHDNISLPSTIKKISELANSILPEKNFIYVSEGLIELGALVCKKKPECSFCPLQKNCSAFQKDLVSVLPKKHAKQKIEKIFRVVGVVRKGNSFFVEKREGNSIMSGLYEFPYVNFDSLELQSILQCKKLFTQKFKYPLKFVKELKTQKHSFTSFRVTLIPLLFEVVSNLNETLENDFFPLESLLLLPFSSGHKRILNELVLLMELENHR